MNVGLVGRPVKPTPPHGAPAPPPPRPHSACNVETLARGCYVCDIVTPTPSATTSTAVARPGILRRHRWKVVAGLFLLAVIAVLASWTAVTLSFTYSDGDRIGFVQKFSRKGWICRTWEGELAMSPVPGAAPQIFSFTVRDEGVANRLAASEGKKVALRYEQKRGVPSSCFGETMYFVTDVRVLAP